MRLDLELGPRERTRQLLLEEGEGKLPKRSVLVVSQVSSVDKAALGEYIGTLSAERIQQIIDGLKFQQASFFNGR